MDKYTENEKRHVMTNVEQPKEWKKMQKKDRDKWLEEQIILWREQKEAEKLVLCSSFFLFLYLVKFSYSAQKGFDNFFFFLVSLFMVSI